MGLNKGINSEDCLLIKTSKGENRVGVNHLWFFPNQIIFCSILTLVRMFIISFLKTVIYQPCAWYMSFSKFIVCIWKWTKKSSLKILELQLTLLTLVDISLATFFFIEPNHTVVWDCLQCLTLGNNELRKSMVDLLWITEGQNFTITINSHQLYVNTIQNRTCTTLFIHMSSYIRFGSIKIFL